MEQDPNEVRLDVRVAPTRLRFNVNNDPVRREGELVIWLLDLWYPKVLRRWMRREREPGTQYTFQTEQEEIDQAMVNIRRAYWSRVQ